MRHRQLNKRRDVVGRAIRSQARDQHGWDFRVLGRSGGIDDLDAIWGRDKPETAVRRPCHFGCKWARVVPIAPSRMSFTRTCTRAEGSPIHRCSSAGETLTRPQEVLSQSEPSFALAIAVTACAWQSVACVENGRRGSIFRADPEQPRAIPCPDTVDVTKHVSNHAVQRC